MIPTPNPFIVALLGRFALRPEQVLVDVGCGPGLYRGITAAQYIGVDRTLEPYGAVPRSVDVVAEAEDLPFAASSVDVVMTVSALYQFPDPNAALREFRRVLRPGGRLLVIDYNRRTQLRLRASEGADRPAWTSLGLVRRVMRTGFDEVTLLVPGEVQRRGIARVMALLREEVRGQWVVVTAVKPKPSLVS